MKITFWSNELRHYTFPLATSDRYNFILSSVSNYIVDDDVEFDGGDDDEQLKMFMIINEDRDCCCDLVSKCLSEEKK